MVVEGSLIISLWSVCGGQLSTKKFIYCSYQNVKEAYNGLKSYFHFYNTIRLHSSLKYMTPYEIYFKEQNKIQNKIQSEDKIKEQVNNLIRKDCLNNPVFCLDIEGRFSFQLRS